MVKRKMDAGKNLDALICASEEGANMEIKTNSADFNANKIPEKDIAVIAKSILDLADTVMAKPGMKERYETWKQKRGANNATCTI